MSDQKPNTTVLLVDDDPLALELTQRMLREDGYAFLTAQSGEEAQEILERPVDGLGAVVLDWRMPGISGIDVLIWMKEQEEFEHLPVVMQTGMVDPEHIREGIECGAFYYLTKPTEQGIFRSVIRAAVSDYHHKQALLERLRKSDNPYQMLRAGTFHIRTLEEAEYLAVRIANSCRNPDRAVYISEIITNAVEHGNLGISYVEKTELIKSGEWNRELERRLALPENVAKFVEVSFTRGPELLTVTVIDQGEGFEFQKYLQMDEARVFDNHGRGIVIARTYINLNYLGSGNKAVITVPCGVQPPIPSVK